MSERKLSQSIIELEQKSNIIDRKIPNVLRAFQTLEQSIKQISKKEDFQESFTYKMVKIES